jgi:hypothetical protein
MCVCVCVFFVQPGYPTNWKALNQFIPYNKNINMCKDCDRDGVSGGAQCAEHKQSPIALSRRATQTRECEDRHLMKYQSGNCRLQNMKL